jgi:hypothetical protein
LLAMPASVESGAADGTGRSKVAVNLLRHGCCQCGKGMQQLHGLSGGHHTSSAHQCHHVTVVMAPLPVSLQGSDKCCRALFGSSGDNYNDCGGLGSQNIANRRSTRQLGRRLDNDNINDKPSRVWERTWQTSEQCSENKMLSLLPVNYIELSPYQLTRGIRRVRIRCVQPMSVLLTV